MRRTRHVVLPVRSWQYIGLLIVSLACLTLGLVSRDREGHAGSLAGPELTHRAPHEVDACPNSLTPFVQTSACPIIESTETTKPVNDRETKVSGPRILSASRKFVFSRSLSVDRASRIGSQETIRERSVNRDLRATERFSRSRTRVSDNESANRLRESRFRTIAERSRDAKSSFDPTTLLSRSRDLSNRATDRRSAERRSLNFEHRPTDRTNSRVEDRRSRSAERRGLNEIARRQNRVDRSVDRQNSLNRERRTRSTSDHRDRRSLTTERQIPSEISQQESHQVLTGRRKYLTRNRVDYRSEMRERRIVERSIDRQDAERSSRRKNREDHLDRSARIVRGDMNRNNNLDGRNRERSPENRRALLDRVANSERRSRLSAARDFRGDIRYDNHRSLSRSMERSRVNDLARGTLNRRVGSNEFERLGERGSSSERTSSARSMERREIGRAERRKAENFANRRSVDRATSRISTSVDSRREKTDRSRNIINQRNSRVNIANRENSRTTLTRSSYDPEGSRERRERPVRSSRSVDRNLADRQELARTKDFGDHDHKSRDSSATRRDLTLERRERTSRLYRSREERSIALRRSRGTERASERTPERRVDSRRSSERRLDESSRLREASRMQDRYLERSPESRISREKILERRSVLDARRTFERRIDDGPRSREASRRQNRRLERSPESRISRERILEERSTLDSRGSSVRRIDDSSRSREASRRQNRRLERSLESRNSQERILERKITLHSRRSSERRTDETFRSREATSGMRDRRLERNSDSRIFRERILEKRSALNSRGSSSERRIDDGPRSREVSRMQDRRAERNFDLRNSVTARMMEREAKSRTASLENKIHRSLDRRSETRRDLQIRSSTERRARSAEFSEKESIGQSRRRSINLNAKDSLKLASLRRVVRVSRVLEQNREQRRLWSAERLLSRIANDDRSSAKWERTLQDARVDGNMEVRTRIVPKSMDQGLLEYPMTNDLMRQAFFLALCTVYGFSLYNGKKSFIGNIAQQMQHFMIW